MKVHVTFYGGLKQDVGVKRQTLDLGAGPINVGKLAGVLQARYPALAERLATVAYAVNDELVDLDYELHDGDEAGLLPPVSGG